MERYVAQLVEDIRHAVDKVKPFHSLWNELYQCSIGEIDMEDLSFIERLLDREKVRVSVITGIRYEQLPPPTKLNIDQQALLSEELEQLLNQHHFILEFPFNYPMHLRYSFIRRFWTERHAVICFGELHVEFCDYKESRECPFPGYCNICTELEDQLRSDAKYWEEDEAVNDSLGLLPSAAEIDNWVKEQEMLLMDKLRKDDFGDYNCFSINEEVFGDNVEFDELDLLPVPGLCIICQKYVREDWTENIFCQQNRYDQRGKGDFECGAFEKI